MSRKIYVASSWRNTSQQEVVTWLRSRGHQVYDFRNPEGATGFAWGELDPRWKGWDAQSYRHMLLGSPRAAQGFMSDFRAMQWCDTCLLVLPCGRSAHLELGWCAGRGKRTIIMLRDGEEPELMNLLADHLVITNSELQDALV
jgi:hypothetical protein